MNNDATLHIRLDSNLKKEIENIAIEFSIKPAAVVRVALEDYVNNNQGLTTAITNDSKINLNNF